MGIGLSAFSGIIRVLYCGENHDASSQALHRIHKAYKFNLEKTVEGNMSGKYSLNFWCFDPGLAMLSLKKLGALSVILTSGTLAPLDSLAKELSL